MKIRFVAPDRLIWLATGAILLWGVWAFVSEVALNIRLGHQIDQLQSQDAQLVTENAQASRDLAGAASPGAMEEEARKYGFARPSEQVYIIEKPTPAAAVATAGASARGLASAPPRAGGLGGAWQAVVRWWQDRWHALGGTAR